jgi:DNA-binding response OmpR family regulator
MDQIEGIELGAEDYLSKPMAAALLVTKVKAVLRRCGGAAEMPKTKLKAHGLEIDLQARVVTSKGKRLPLTRKEFDLLLTFLRRPGQVISMQYLLETVWGYDPADYNDPHTIGVHISSLRKKIGPVVAKRIVNVPSLGYRFDADI